MRGRSWEFGNAIFGVIAERIGFGISIYILPVASVLFLVPFGILTFCVKKVRKYNWL